MHKLVKTFAFPIGLYLVQLVGERYMTNAPDWIWRVLFWVAIAWIAAGVLALDPIWHRLRRVIPTLRIVWPSEARKQAAPTEHLDLSQYQSKENEVISGHIFRNCVVEIDGKTFDRCTFEHVTLMFRGRSHYVFLGNNTYIPPIRIATDNAGAMGFMDLMQWSKRSSADQITVMREDKQTGMVTEILADMRRMPVPQAPTTSTNPKRFKKGSKK